MCCNFQFPAQVCHCEGLKPCGNPKSTLLCCRVSAPCSNTLSRFQHSTSRPRVSLRGSEATKQSALPKYLKDSLPIVAIIAIILYSFRLF